jgi:hypothetical protein
VRLLCDYCIVAAVNWQPEDEVRVHVLALDGSKVSGGLGEGGGSLASLPEIWMGYFLQCEHLQTSEWYQHMASATHRQRRSLCCLASSYGVSVNNETPFS